MYLIIAALPLLFFTKAFGEEPKRSTRWKILCVAVCAFIPTMMIGLVAPMPLNLGLYLIMFAAITAALIYWCGIDRKRAARVAGYFVGVYVLLGILAAVIF